ncbi:HEXXH motif-containing putative peptide modification protein [Streptomyces sp. LX-29]|uniref:aKG-HExxH-type peptide beta-hydroxylase n=1 Tax=Streptomyces sp. LX-29 TaxID=2900152 RepID=UPI00240E6098|nr:HEXXH motif-containing putative peptide modification protein [Streptomyces sp. LX-29]WFB10579.1 HEXXH motif-containing putative peptide modification protein [Streptomyces sp. LX-29]
MGVGRDELIRVGMTSTGTASLVRSYQRAVLRRLEPRLPEGHEPSGLHPALVWEATRTSAGSSAAHASGTTADRERIADLIRGLATAGPMPALEHVALGASSCPDWCLQGAEELLSDIQRTTGASDAAFSAPNMTEATAHVEAARETLRRVWPEAALETDLLIRVIVYVQAGAFRSATLRQTFGAVYLGTASVESTPAAFEALLHETGHHALYLRNHFETFVTNGDDMVTHSLRADPRPVAGAVHAAHVLARMTYGLARWARERSAPPEVSERRDSALRRLQGTIAALKPVAEWTDRGRSYFDDLLRWEQELTDAHPG